MESNDTTRKEFRAVKVYFTADEREEIGTKAKAADMSLSQYLARVGLGFELRPPADREQAQELARINADLGRLGGLLKLWLTDDARTAQVGASTIRAALARIEGTQALMRQAIQWLMGGGIKREL